LGEVFSNYLRGTAFAVLMYMVTLSAALLILGAPYAIILGMIAGAVYLVPYLNVVISTLLVFVLTGISHRTGNWFFHSNDPWAFAA
ncbi:hypothetical protein ABTM87_19635, partial [Acinetobacter baumannii]